MSDKLAVIVPFRNRHEHLNDFKVAITEYLTKKGCNFELIIVEQDNAKLFNRGMLLNIGFKYAQKLKCNYVVFHDVDMIPLAVDYSYAPHPVHLATKFTEHRELFDQYFGGVTLFNTEDFVKVDGYSNKYWGWGYEDDDLLHRCIKKSIKLETLKIKNVKQNLKALKFNGVNSYVKGKNNFNVAKSISFFVSFYPDAIICDHTKESDDFNIFTIPGYDLAISYNSFSRYNFYTFTSDNKVLYANSEIKKNYQTNIGIVIDHEEKVIKMYQDGTLIGVTENFRKLHSYSKEEFFYLGAGNINSSNKKMFRGYIDSFIVYDKALSSDEIKALSQGDIIENNKQLHYNVNSIERYHLVDLSSNENNGKIYNCAVEELELGEFTEIPIPARRKSLFKSLPHEDNGFHHNRWKDDNTRWNQLRFINEVSLNPELIINDGLSTLQFIEHGIKKEKNITHVNVGI
jgi:hypothetical protein